MPSTTVILGAGFGGIATANTLRAAVPSENRIILVDKSSDFVIGATKTWVAIGEAKASAVVKPRRRIIAEGVEFIVSDVSKIDPANRIVVCGDKELSADYLVIALGADYDMSVVPGLSEAAQEFYTMQGAEKLNRALQEFSGGRIVILIPRTPFKCPPGPYEGAFLFLDHLKKRGLADKTSIDIYTVEQKPMATAGPEMGDFIISELEKRGIGFHPQTQTQSVDPSARVVKFQDGRSASYDLLIAIPPHVAPKVVREAGLVGQGGWIPVKPDSLQVALDFVRPGRVYAIGDVSVLPLPGRFKPDVPLVLPKAGTFAEGEGRIVAARIASEILGGQPKDAYHGRGFCYLELGDGHALRGDGDFFALPHPTMTRTVPDMGQYEEKKRWVEAWPAAPK